MKIRLIGTASEINCFLWKHFHVLPRYSYVVDSKTVASVSRLYPSRAGEGIYRCYIDMTEDFYADLSKDKSGEK